MSATHSQQTLADGLHSVVSYTYANETERVNAGPFISEDIYKLSIQLDNGSIWILTNPATVNWVQVTAGVISEAVSIPVLKASAGTITKGQAVRIAGWSDGSSISLVELAQSDSPTTMPCVGIVQTASVTDSVSGSVLLVGVLTDVSTTGLSPGPIYVSSTTPGALTNTPPTGPSLVQPVGSCLEVGVTGTLGVNILGYRALSDEDPLPLGAADPGTGSESAREDHVHAHGNQGGGSEHAVATTSVAGFLSATDKTKLDGLSNTNLSNATPVNVSTTAGSSGTSGDASRADHKHSIDTAAPSASAVQVGNAAAEGSSSSLSRADHIHAVSVGTPVTVTRSANAAGSANTFARSDHKHDVSADPPQTLTPGNSNTEGTASSLARSDHVHGLPAFGTTSGTFCQGNDSRLSDDRTADGLRTTTTIVDVGSALAPSTGQYLQASGASSAAWVNFQIEDDTAPALGGDLDAQNNDLDNIATATFNSENNAGNSGSSITIDWNDGQKQSVTLTAASVTLSFTNPPGPGNFILKIVQDGTGNRTIGTYPTNSFSSGGSLSLTSTASAVDIAAIYFDGTNYYWTLATDMQSL
jgi:hypothetical protein